ncbi:MULTISPECIES: aldo/keto reductase [unclassified Caballeronia]|uniref:aldo/keto reductase n=1 Tax=unclassified Caballeronia TaxID=2646786 RepID=UPI00202774A6|nr:MULTISPECIES: aldo/keto reductase [unclassified Caballeronia]MDR5763935.1 aldo/keto reductase [Caballeronia sp. LZ028]MDR5785814.1 aldo/keto reductase [Caballeronia sp. LP003]MDR5791845.1 aldo/keto reductase [Caballeronia sp. LZ008]
MQTRNIGTSELKVAPLVFGGNVFGWTANERTSFSILDAFVDHGLNFIDTADVYSAWVDGHQGGESETIIGKWFRESGKRHQVVLATKVGKLSTRAGLSAANIAAAVDDSLRRLKTDYIDVYFSHYDDETTPLDETLDAYQTLIKAGKVRVIGASNYTGERLEEALKVAKDSGLPAYQILQPEYNLYDREGYETGLEPVAEQHKIAVVPYYALASGFLSGKYRSKADTQHKARGSRVEKYLTPRGLEILDALDEVAKRNDTTPATVALAWMIARPSVTAPIASATSVAQLESLAAATRLQLAADDIHLLDEASAWQK